MTDWVGRIHYIHIHTYISAVHIQVSAAHSVDMNGNVTDCKETWEASRCGRLGPLLFDRESLGIDAP